jgi:hypothetical protein
MECLFRIRFPGSPFVSGNAMDASVMRENPVAAIHGKSEWMAILLAYIPPGGSTNMGNNDVALGLLDRLEKASAIACGARLTFDNHAVSVVMRYAPAIPAPVASFPEHGQAQRCPVLLVAAQSEQFAHIGSD